MFSLSSTGAESGPLVVMRYLIVVTVITRQRMTSMLIQKKARHPSPSDPTGSSLQKLYAPFVAPNKRFGKCASTVVCAWENTSARHASFLMMIYPRDSIIVMDVVFAGIISSYWQLEILISSLNRIMIGIGGQENFFHCDKCGCCYSNLLRESHPCIERAMHHDCPVCLEYLFDSINDVGLMPCGHTIHNNCLKEMQQHMQFACPLCLKSVCDMSKFWEKLDIEVAATPMPEFYHNKVIWILCNDCGTNSQVAYHVVAHQVPQLQLLQHSPN
ncbi:hypothetical protein OSB04_022222 [Centaurea solstitialis]|uniref:Uncharacterized protein n=1 Tax=Centaurea solstitialis TaxID=347529 RepID=A0AA38WH11_9ASTR|nr:hypothetical protein OSB04_022222 [Centaurea solstitialis]